MRIRIFISCIFLFFIVSSTIGQDNLCSAEAPPGWGEYVIENYTGSAINFAGGGGGNPAMRYFPIKHHIVTSAGANPQGLDPAITFSIVQNLNAFFGCQYVGNELDQNNDPYAPDTGNVMAYLPTGCRMNFSGGQYDRVCEAANDPNQLRFPISTTVAPAPMPIVGCDEIAIYDCSNDSWAVNTVPVATPAINQIEQLCGPNSSICFHFDQPEFGNLQFSFDNGLNYLASVPNNVSSQCYNLPSGSYQIVSRIILENGMVYGCPIFLDNVTITNDVLTVSIMSDQPYYCVYDNGFVNAVVQNGQSPYTYSWSNGQTTTVPQLNISTEISQGQYTTIGLTVTDANGCQASDDENFYVYNYPEFNILATNSSTCDSELGSVEIEIFDYVEASTLIISFDGGQTFPMSQSNDAGVFEYTLAQGSYQLVISDPSSNACASPIQEFTIEDECTPLNLICTDNPDVITIGDKETPGTETISNIIASHGLTSPIIGQEFYVNGSLIIDVDVELQQCTLFFEDDSDCVVNADVSEFRISNQSLLTSCTDTWEGIDLNGNMFRIEDSSIENAFRGIEDISGLEPSLFISNCTLAGNYEALSLEGNNSTFWFFNNTVIGPDYDYGDSPHDWMTGAYYLPKGINLVDTESSFNSIGSGNEGESYPNTFENLFYGIFASNSDIRVANSTFREIGTSHFPIGITVPSGAFIPRTAIRTIQSPRVNSITNCTVEDCSRGFWLQSANPRVTDCPKIEVFDMGIAGNSGLRAFDNIDITSSWIGIRALSGINQRIENNNITIFDSPERPNSSGIHLADGASEYNVVKNNTISIFRGRAGILAQNMSQATLEENTIRVLFPEESSGIVSEDGTSLNISCNDISSTYGIQPGNSTGILSENSETSLLSNNQVSDLTTGILMESGSSVMDINCTEFLGGHTGLKVESFIGQQSHGVNAWADGAYQVDAESSFTNEQNQVMQFEVADSDPMGNCPPQSMHLFPCEIIGDDWFVSELNGPSTCQDAGCEGNVGADGLLSTEDELEQLCEWNAGRADTLSCEEQWVQDYQLYSMIKAEGIDTLRSLQKYDCLATFMKDIADSPITTFYTIDSLLTVQDSLLADSLNIATEKLDEAVQDQDERDDTIDALYTHISDLLMQLDSLHQYNLTHADSLLTQVGRDSCDIITDWELVYDVLIDEQKGEEITQRQIADLESVALKCPTHVGHVIYSARRIVSDRTHLRYDLIDDCGRVETRSSQQSPIIDPEELSIVPNPATDLITIGLPEAGDGTLTIQSLNGQVMYQQDIYETVSHNVMTTAYRSGIYIVSFDSISGEHYVTKLVIVE